MPHLLITITIPSLQYSNTTGYFTSTTYTLKNPNLDFLSNPCKLKCDLGAAINNPDLFTVSKLAFLKI